MNKMTVIQAVLFSTLSLSSSLYAANNTQLRIQTSESKRLGETAFSTLVSWRKGDESVKDINGLTFVNGTDTTAPFSASDIAENMAKSLNAAIVVRTPLDRGAVAEQQQSELLIRNQAGFDLTRITTRDYSNQRLTYSIPQQSFQQAETGLAIDIVYSAAVEYIAGFSTAVKQETAGGFVTVTIDSQAPIKIKTDGKTIREIETELADALGDKASFSMLPIYPNFVQKRSKNYKAFDGGEVQLPNLNARSISIDIHDSGLGVLTKFVFNEVEQPLGLLSKLPYLIGLFAVGLLAYVSRKKSV